MSNSEVNTVTPPPPQETAPAPVEAVVEERVSMLKELNICKISLSLTSSSVI